MMGENLITTSLQYSGIPSSPLSSSQEPHVFGDTDSGPSDSGK